MTIPLQRIRWMVRELHRCCRCRSWGPVLLFGLLCSISSKFGCSPLQTRPELTADVTHYLLDLYITILSIPNPNELAHHPSPVSPKESPATNSTVPTQSPSTTAYSLSPFWTSQTLTEVKIRLRETRPGRAVPVGTGWIGTMADTEGNPGQSREVEEAIEGMGQNDKTVRFLWDVAGQ